MEKTYLEDCDKKKLPNAKGLALGLKPSIKNAQNALHCHHYYRHPK
jgi:hypothetical protein